MPEPEQPILEDSKYQSNTQTQSYPLDRNGIRDLIKDETQKLKEEIKKQQDDLKESKKDLITVLGLFATFLTFTTVEFQLIKTLNGLPDFISLSLLIISLAVILAVVIKHDFSKKEDDIFKNRGLHLGIGLLVLSIIFFYISNTNYRSPRNNMQIMDTPNYNLQIFKGY